MSKEYNNALDALLMAMMGTNGNTKAHWWLTDRASGGKVLPNRVEFYLSGRYPNTRVFQPPKAEDRVLMFDDFSGVYIHSDGLSTILGSDISDQVNDWPLLHGPDWFTTPLPA